jgi:hypothetical protein
MTFGPAHFVEDKIARDLQQPGCKLRPRDVAAGTSPNPDKNLLRDIFDISIASEHSGDCPSYKCLVPFDQSFERSGVAAGHQRH